MHFAKIAQFGAIAAIVVIAGILTACSGVPSEPRTFSDELHDAARAGDLREIRSLIGQGADVNARDPDGGDTPLDAAVRNRQVEAAEQLMLQGADPNRRTRGSTPLHLAAERGIIELARLLLDHGANAEMRDLANLTPLEVAQEKGHTRFVFFLQDEIQARRRVN